MDEYIIEPHNLNTKDLLSVDTFYIEPSTEDPQMSAQAQMRALLDQLMGTARDGSVYLCQPTSICKGVAEKPHVHRAVSHT